MAISMNIHNMCRIAEHCSGVATPQARDELSRPQGILEHIINFFTFGGVRRKNAKLCDAFARAMTAVLQQESLCMHCNTLPERLVVDFLGYSVIFTQLGENHNAAGTVTIEVSKGGETVTAEVDKDRFCRISLALQLRHKGRLLPTSAVLTDSNLINLRGADLRGVNLNMVDLSKADLCDANLCNANLCVANLRGANLAWANLDKAKLSGANMSGTNLEFANLCNAHLYAANLSGANLTGADLSSANLDRANLCGAKLYRNNLYKTNLNGADLGNILCGGTLLNIPLWSNMNLDTYLNHINNPSGSFLTMIDNIDDRHVDVKLRMVRELMTSLREAQVNLFCVAPSLMDILSKAPYTEATDIVAWLDRVCKEYLSRYNAQVLPWNQGVFNHSVALFSRQPEMMFSHNGAFIQVIAQGMNEERTPAVRKAVVALYETYLQHERIRPYCHSIEDFGNGEGAPDWSDKHAANFILISAEPAAVSAMLLSQSVLQGMLTPQPDSAWDNFYLYKDLTCLSAKESPSLSELFANAFPLFLGPYEYMQKNATFIRLLRVLKLEELQAQFVSATQERSSEIKLIDEEHQKRLGDIFTPYLIYQVEVGRYGLSDAHYDEIISAYNLASANDEAKGQTLLCLAALFTKYSSSAILGTETDSPELLRRYAYALMEKAHTLNTALLDTKTFSDWTNRLLGLEGAFSCSAVLSSAMVQYIRERFPTVLSGIMPPVWG